MEASTRRVLGARAVAVLGLLAWAVIPVALLIGVVLVPDMQRDVVAGGTVLIVAFLVARLVLAAWAWRSRRTTLLLLLLAITLWGLGSAQLTSADRSESLAFPAPGEWFFIASYVAFAAFLLLDAGARRSGIDKTLWLDATVVIGGAATLTGMVLLTPWAPTMGNDGLPLLLALLYPLLDTVLLLTVVAQAVLRLRSWNLRTASLVGGFVLLLVADLSFIRNLGSGVYEFSPLLDVLWGASLILIVDSACQPVQEVSPSGARRPGPVLLVAAASVAVFVLAWHPQEGFGPYLVWTAVLTLVAAGARLVLALRDSHAVTESLRLARTDDTTGLPNRRFMLATLSRRLGSRIPLSLMIVDLDGFKEVNESLGHSCGDDVLRLAGERIGEAVPGDAFVAHLSGDEFAVIVPHADALRLVELGQRVRAHLQLPARLDGVELELRSTIGITVREPDDRVGTDLLRRADVALFQAKADRAGVLVYDASADTYSRDRLRLEEELRRAVESDRLQVWYQPQVDAATQQISGMEALVRWPHPTMGMVSPAIFLPVARRSGLMPAVSELVVRHVVRDAVAWQRAGLSFHVAVNLAPPELLGGVVLPFLFAATRAAHLPPERLVVEVTEDSFLSDPARAREVLAEVRGHGLQVSVDDFGTGFSSLGYLRDLPLHELKIDRSFVVAARTEERSRMIVTFTTSLAHGLGLRVVAEGVENAATAADLVAMGVDVLQGYHIARPMPGPEVETWARRWDDELAAQYPVRPASPE